MANIGEPQRFIISEPIYEPVPPEPTSVPDVQPLEAPAEQPQEVPA